MTKGKSPEMLLMPDVWKVSQSDSQSVSNWLTIVHKLRTDNNFHAHSNAEQLGEVLSTCGQIYLRAVDKGRLSYTPFLTMPFGFGPRICIGRSFAELKIETLVTKVS
jgi:hypothetical protein